jgi:hypothetical protein
MRYVRTLAALALTLSTTAAHAGVVLNAHNRSIEADISNMIVSDNQTDAAPDANPFNAVVIAQVDFQADPSVMLASQNSSFGVAGGSTLTANVISAAVSNTGVLPGGLTRADSTFELDFTLDAPGTFSLTGTASVSGAIPDPGFYAGYVIALTGPGGLEFNFNDDFLMPGVNNQVFAEAGNLVAGNYQLVIRAVTGGAGNVDERADLDVAFSVNSPAGPNGPGPNVPLPAAAWPAAAAATWLLNKRRLA